MWFSLQQDPNRLEISFQRCAESAWNPQILAEHPLPKHLFSGQLVVLNGKAPMWMYAHAAVVAIHGGAREIRVSQPQLPEPVTVHPLVGAPCPDPGWLQLRENAEGGTIASFCAPLPGMQWEPSSLPSLLESAQTWNSQLVTFTGPAPNWWYAAAGALAANDRQRDVVYFSPKDGVAILLNPGNDGRVAIPPSPSLLLSGGDPGKIIGVVGDPNSGKSIFSYLLEHAFGAAGLKPVWRMDCDHAAATPNWYLQMIRQGRTVEATGIRDLQKRRWTPEAEEHLAEGLRNCARCMKWTLADFPGGIHKDGPALRIPPGREVLLRLADYFVVLVRDDLPEAEKCWREALRPHGLEKRIIAVVTSSAHKTELSLQFDRANDTGVTEIRANVKGLDRSNLTPDQIRTVLPDVAELARNIAACVPP